MEIVGCETSDFDGLLDLMAAFYEESGYPFSREKAHQVLEKLLTTPALGRVWLQKDGANYVGYVVLCYCFSFEHGGRDAFVDEIFISPECRGQGSGRQLLSHAIEQLPELGVRALHLEVEDDNSTALGLYEKIGFRKSSRRLMTLRA